MGTYISKADVDAIFGLDNVAVWSNLDNDDAQANLARVNSAIDDAERHFEDRMRSSRYAVPFVGTLNVIKRAMARLAGAMLYEARGSTDEGEDDRMQGHRDGAEDVINRLLSGRMVMDAADSGTHPTAPVVVMPAGGGP